MRHFQPAFSPALSSPFRRVNEKRGFRERLRERNWRSFLQGGGGGGAGGWRGRDVTLITDERRDGQKGRQGKRKKKMESRAWASLFLIIYHFRHQRDY